MLGETKDMTLTEIEEEFKIADLVVYEGFWLRKDIAESGRWNWNEGEVMQVVGVIKSLASRYQKQLEKVQSGQRIPGYAWVGMKFDPTKRGKGVHQKDALAHAVSYAVRRLGARPVSGHLS